MNLRKYVGTSPLIMVAACVVVHNDNGEILLQKRIDTGDWGTLGGSMELGETFEETAARELFEKAGLRAKSFELITVLSGKDMYFRYPHGDEVYNVLAVLEAREVEGEPKVNDEESLELAYFNLSEKIESLNPFSELILTKAGYLVQNREVQRGKGRKYEV